MYAVYVRVGLVALACATTFWLGDRLASGRYEKRLADISQAIAKSQDAAVERHNLELASERKRANEALASRSQRRQVAQGVIHEVARDTDRSCEWREPHRVRVESIYHAYGYYPDGSTAGVSDSLPAPSVNSTAPGAVGGSGINVGRGLRGPAQ